MLANKIHIASVDNLAGGGGGLVPSITDDFNRADGAPGANWTVTTGGGGPVINTNRFLVYAEVGMANLARWTTDLESTDLWIEADYLAASVQESTAAHQLLLRAPVNLALTCYAAGWGHQNLRWEILKYVNGAQTVIATLAAPTPTVDHRLRFEAQGTNLRFYIDDELTLSGSDVTHSTPAGVGFRSAQRSSYWDNFAAGVF